MSRRSAFAVAVLLVLAWLAAMGIGGPFFGRLAEVQSQSGTDFLPASSESTQVAAIQARLDEGGAIPAVIVYEAEAGLSPEANAVIAAQLADITALDGIAGASPPIPSAGTTAAGLPRAAEVFVFVSGDLGDTVAEIREITGAAPEGLTAYVTGPAGFAADLTAAFAGIDGILLLVAVGVVFLILLVVYRSPILPFLVLFSSVGALAAAVVGVYYMADAGWITLNGQAQGILFILVIGAATDYALLFVARYRDALRHEPDVRAALWRAWRGVVEPVLASAGTVIAGLLCLLLSDLNSNKALGPVGAIGIAFAVLASLTFLPAMLALTRRAAFWPFTPRPDTGQEGAEERGFWPALARLVSRRYRPLWTVGVLVLLIAAVFVPRLDATGVPESEVLLGEAESARGQAALGRWFAAGSGTPIEIIADAADAAGVTALVAADAAVAAVGPRNAGGAPGAPPVPRALDGRQVVEIEATLNVAADSDAALDTVERLRSGLHAAYPGTLVGGQSATDLDTRTEATRDLWTIVPIILVVITLIVMALLRSVLAPLILIATTVLSFLATLGLSALVFDTVFGFPGADPVVPLFAFVFLVALGIDYNIFLSTRIREEALHRGTRAGILRGLTVTGGVITSAGIVLAATFAALAVIPLVFLVQIAFIVALGVLIDAIFVRSILVPAILTDIGPRIWWPSRLSRDPVGAAVPRPKELKQHG